MHYYTSCLADFISFVHGNNEQKDKINTKAPLPRNNLNFQQKKVQKIPKKDPAEKFLPNAEPNKTKPSLAILNNNNLVLATAEGKNMAI